MVGKKKDAKEEKTQEAAQAPVRARRRGMGWRARLMLAVLMMVGAAFLPVTVVLLVGMLPAFVAFMVDPTRSKTLALTIMLMNFITCFPYLMDAAGGGLNLHVAYTILTEPLNIVIMFSGAAAGYFLDWALAGMSNVIMVSRAKMRLEDIEKRQEELVRRFGPEVTGEMELDADGFPLVLSPEDK